jgi:hypothetical protein
MAWRSVPFATGGAAVAAFLLLVPSVMAGDRVRSQSSPIIASKPAPAPVAQARVQPAAVSFVVAPPAQTAKDPRFVRLRGPDGQVRSFPVVGGPDAIQYARPVVLRSGQSITITFVTRR